MVSTELCHCSYDANSCLSKTTTLDQLKSSICNETAEFLMTLKNNPNMLYIYHL